MSGTLYQEGRHITDVGIQPNGDVAVSSGGVGGEFFFRIPAKDRSLLSAALAKICDRSLPDQSLGDLPDSALIELFEKSFKNTLSDPFDAIKKFLEANNVPFKESYWPTR